MFKKSLMTVCIAFIVTSFAQAIQVPPQVDSDCEVKGAAQSACDANVKARMEGDQNAQNAQNASSLVASQFSQSLKASQIIDAWGGRTIHGERVLFVTHPSTEFDTKKIAEAAIRREIIESREKGIPVIILLETSQS